MSEWYVGCLYVSEGHVGIGQVRTGHRSSRGMQSQVGTGQVKLSWKVLWTEKFSDPNFFRPQIFLDPKFWWI